MTNEANRSVAWPGEEPGWLRAMSQIPPKYSVQIYFIFFTTNSNFVAHFSTSETCVKYPKRCDSTRGRGGECNFDMEKPYGTNPFPF